MVLLEVCTGARFGVLAVVVEVFAAAVGAGPVTVSTPFPGGGEVVFDGVLRVDQGTQNPNKWTPFNVTISSQSRQN